jgi:hypothetical protein
MPKRCWRSLPAVAGGGRRLLQALRAGLAELSGCELVQLYLLDATHTRLGMKPSASTAAATA